MQKVKIDKKVPMPMRSHARYPWEQMKVGDSFYVPEPGKRSGFYSIAARHGYKVAVRNDGEGVRVWRTE